MKQINQMFKVVFDQISKEYMDGGDLGYDLSEEEAKEINLGKFPVHVIKDLREKFESSSTTDFQNTLETHIRDYLEKFLGGNNEEFEKYMKEKIPSTSDSSEMDSGGGNTDQRKKRKRQRKARLHTKRRRK